MKISFFEVSSEEEKELSSKLKGHELIFSNETLSLKNIKSVINSDIISIFIHSKINKSLIGKLKNIKMIVTRSTGYDHIDLKECKKRGIVVCNVPTYGENTVAEHTFALILDLSRNIHKSFMKVRKDDFSIQGLKGFDLKGKTIGVIGVGHIGENVIRIAHGFGMNILAHDRNIKKQLQKEIPFTYTTLRNLLKNSDIVSLHIPLTGKTKHLINKNTIKIMKPGSILVNTSRGEVVDTKALLSSLKNNHLAGAGLDVIEGEEIIKEEKELLQNHHDKHSKKPKNVIDSYMILHNEKVIFTPHIAFYSSEALERIMKTTIDNISCFISKKPKCVINLN